MSCHICLCQWPCCGSRADWIHAGRGYCRAHINEALSRDGKALVDADATGRGVDTSDVSREEMTNADVAQVTACDRSD